MAAVGSPEPKKTKKKGKKMPKRVGFKLDMTPMVDVAFLLLTFFMLTTTFSKPKTMEINLPAEKNTNEVKVAESNVLTVRVMEGDKAYWNIGFKPPQAIPLYETDGDAKPTISEKFRKMLRENRDRIRQEVGEDVMVLVLKLDKKARYRNLVDIIDELNIANPPIKRFSIADFTEEDAKEIAQMLAGGAPPQPQPPQPQPKGKGKKK
ncbi:MAG: biopolymer transporter ExbD [Chloroherpetonaceae bacterium]|nr:biopolymer transporter ExbD [Chloroherpetonaceae bacterium]MDW8436919.1 biopolymer transporter ExbD [Chloroherpetonaceae bacterium]